MMHLNYSFLTHSIYYDMELTSTGYDGASVKGSV
jgi:hypothetical protein